MIGLRAADIRQDFGRAAVEIHRPGGRLRRVRRPHVMNRCAIGSQMQLAGCFPFSVGRRNIEIFVADRLAAEKDFEVALIRRQRRRGCDRRLGLRRAPKREAAQRKTD